jgi:hypothetical protein
MKRSSHPLAFFAPLVAALWLPVVAGAQSAPPVLRGNVTAVSGDSLTVKTIDGKTSKIALAKDWRVTVLKPVDVSSIQAGSFIGTAEMPQKDGSGRSLEVHVFPPGVKAGEGHYTWDSKPGSMMTNGTVGEVKSNGKGRELQVSYPNGERKIVVPPGVPVVLFTNGEQSQVKPGIPVFLLVGKSADGGLTSTGVVIGENGAKPPM